MLKLTSSLFIVFIGLSTLRAQTTIQVGTTTLEVDTVITGLDIPWEILIGPDNYLWVTERKGIVSRIHPETGVKTLILDLVASVHQQAESGMLGMALHPEFSLTPEVFLAYTYLDGASIRERLVKYTFDGSALVNPTVLLNGIPGNSTHNGARLLFLADQTLLMSTGDAQNLALPQNINSLAGKILRLHTDGSIPADNPIDGNPMYSFGHRNVQGLWLHPNGSVWMSEHGAATDDEFQVLIPGRNYGWPEVEGFCTTTAEINFCAENNVVEPALVWTPTVAPSDLVFYENPNFPEWHNTFLMTVLKDKKLISIRLNETQDGIEEETHYLTNLFGRLRDICIGTEKEIYLATNGPSWSNTQPNTHSIIRLKVVQSDLSIAQYYLDAELYPNPFLDLVKIKLAGGNETMNTVAVFTAEGRQVARVGAEGETVELDLTALPAGMYTVEIHTNSGLVVTKKIIKHN